MIMMDMTTMIMVVMIMMVMMMLCTRMMFVVLIIFYTYTKIYTLMYMFFFCATLASPKPLSLHTLLPWSTPL